MNLAELIREILRRLRGSPAPAPAPGPAPSPAPAPAPAPSPAPAPAPAPAPGPAPAPAPAPVAGWPLHDGQYDGPTHSYQHPLAQIAWTRPGGDWVDRAGVEFGSLPWATLSVPAGAGQVTVDVSDLARSLPVGSPVELYLRAASADRSFQTRQGAAPPTLEVTYVDGTTAVLPCTSDGFFSGSTSYSLSARPDMILGTGWVAFAPPARVIAQARLRLSALAGSASTISVFRLRKPVDVVIPATGGLASGGADVLQVYRPRNT